MNAYHQPIKQLRKQNKTPSYLIKFEHNWLRDPQKETPENTISQRLICVAKFDSWLEKNPSFRQRFNKTWNKVCRKGRIFFMDKEILRTFFTYLHDKDYSVSTRSAYRASLETFFDYAYETEQIDIKPSWARIFIKKTNSEKQKEKKKPLTFKDVQKIRNYLWAKHVTTPEQLFKKFRDMALLECLAATGARVGEIVQIRADKFDLNICVVEIFGSKTSQIKEGWRIVPIQASSCHIVQDYIKKYRRAKSVPDMIYLFPPLDNPTSSDHIKEYEVKNAVRSWARALNMLHLSPHRFRHYFITRLCEAKSESGNPLYSVEQVAVIAGCDVSTIQKYYYHPSMRRIVETFHVSGVQL